LYYHTSRNLSSPCDVSGSETLKLPGHAYVSGPTSTLLTPSKLPSITQHRDHHAQVLASTNMDGMRPGAAEGEALVAERKKSVGSTSSQQSSETWSRFLSRGLCCNVAGENSEEYGSAGNGRLAGRLCWIGLGWCVVSAVSGWGRWRLMLIRTRSEDGDWRQGSRLRCVRVR
jgi:hypothetical protein